MLGLKLAAIRAMVLEAPIDPPVETSFGTMNRRTAILVCAEADNGLQGWGESWSNFPSWSRYERVHTVLDGVAPLVLGRDPREVVVLHQHMTNTTATLGRQWGAPGPIAQAISAIDIALWDLLGKVVEQPLYRILGGASGPVPVYASGLGPTAPDELAEPLRSCGVRAFKLKVGFGFERDEANLALMRERLGPDVDLLVDANQAWDVDTAMRMLPMLERYRIGWLEEPVAADDFEGMAALRARTSLRIAAGENLYGLKDFHLLLATGAADVVQPDPTKVGGITESLRVAALASAHGRGFAPHFLGNAVGFLAAAHLFAAVPGGLMLELDANPNPLRDRLANGALQPVEGCIRLSEAPGLGWNPPPDVLDDYTVDSREVRY